MGGLGRTFSAHLSYARHGLKFLAVHHRDLASRVQQESQAQ
jgi:hypothetical protein